MILHLVNDHQVINRTLDYFEQVFPGENIVFVFSDNTRLIHVKPRNLFQIVSEANYRTIAQNTDFSQIDKVIVHYMSIKKIRFIQKIPKHLHVCWNIYGWDLYSQFLFYKGYKLFYSNPDSFRPLTWKRKLFPQIAYIKDKLRSGKYFNYIIKRTDSLVVSCLPDKTLLEFYARRSFPTKEIFSYPIETTLGDLYGKEFQEGKDIMLGNSASFTNNHLYALNYLSGLDLKNSKIHLQLAYGGTEVYKKYVTGKYEEAFHDKLVINDKYLPISEYNNYLLNMRILIFANWRQEAEGNILMGFYLGAKIFLSNKNPLFLYYKFLGFIIFELETISQQNLDHPLTPEEKDYNRNIAKRLYANERLLNLIRENFS